MTIALGVIPHDGSGVVVATDSLRCEWRDGQPYRVDLEGEKFIHVGERMLLIVSGQYPAAWRPDPRWAHELTAAEVARAALAELLAFQDRGEWPDGTHGPRPVDVLVAGGDPPELALARSRGAGPTWAGGKVLIGGSMAAWAAGHLVCPWPPADLAEAVYFAEGACRGYIEDSYRRWDITLDDVRAAAAGMPGAPVPPAAPPFHVVAITREGVTRWKSQ